MVQLSGRLVPRDQVSLSFVTEGVVRTINVQKGDRVQVGEVLAELEIDGLSSQTERARGDLEAAQALLTEAQEDLGQERAVALTDLAIARATLVQAQVANSHAITEASLTLELAEEELARLQVLGGRYVAGVAEARTELSQAQEQRGRARTEYAESQERGWETAEAQAAYARERQLAEWRAEIAQARYAQAVADEESHQHSVAAQQILIRRAEAERERLREGIDPRLPLEVERAKLVVDSLTTGVGASLYGNVNRAQLLLAQLEAEREKARLRTPLDGTVVDISVRPWERATSVSPAVTLADLESLYLEATDLSQFDVARVGIGQRAQVILDAFPDQQMTGQVAEIAMRASIVEGDRVVYVVRVALDASEVARDLRWGMTGIAQIVLTPP